MTLAVDPFEVSQYQRPLDADFSYLQPTYGLEETQRMEQAMHDDGFCLIPNVLNEQEVDRMRSEIDRLRPFGMDFCSDVKDHYKNVWNRDPYWLDYMDKPGVIDLAEATMGQESHIIGMTAWRTRPGNPAGGFHQDTNFVDVPESVFDDPNYRLPIYICTAHYYLDEVSMDLGPTMVVPGSHKAGRGPNAEEREQKTWHGKPLQPVLCKPGDVLFFRSEIWHMGAENLSERSRYLLQVHYSHRNVAPRFSPYLDFSISNHVLSQASKRQRRLMGEHKQVAYG